LVWVSTAGAVQWPAAYGKLMKFDVSSIQVVGDALVVAVDFVLAVQ
jgi:hypothetical protein